MRSELEAPESSRVRKVNSVPVGAPSRRHQFTGEDSRRGVAARQAKREAGGQLRARLRRDLIRILGHDPSDLEEALINPVLRIIEASLTRRLADVSLEEAKSTLETVTKALRALKMASEGAFERELSESEKRAAFRRQVFGESNEAQ